MTGTPLAAPEGRATLTVSTHPLIGAKTRHRVYTYGDDPRVINPGDLLIETILGGGTGYSATIETYFSGREVHHLADAALAAAALYDEHAPWLSANVSRVVA